MMKKQCVMYDPNLSKLELHPMDYFIKPHEIDFSSILGRKTTKVDKTLRIELYQEEIIELNEININIEGSV